MPSCSVASDAGSFEPVIVLERQGGVFVVQMVDGENRFNRPFVEAMHRALDIIESYDGPCAMVTTGSGKFYSNGLDLEWLGSGEDTTGFLESVYALFARILGLDVYTVAAVNGHAFAAGAMLASVHDSVIMRADRGYWCLPEVDLGFPLTPEMYAALAAHIELKVLAQASLTGRRFSAEDAVAAGIAAESQGEDNVLPRAVEIASGLADKNRRVIAAHKTLLYGQAIANTVGAREGNDRAIPADPLWRLHRRGEPR
jgi:Delta3-Delta2-enoyl-CoA isomerase